MDDRTYSRGQVWLHWTIAALLVVSFFSHDAMKHAWIALHRGGTADYPMLHIVSGIAVLALVAVRLGLRLRNGAPKLPDDTPGWMKMSSAATHGLIYLLLVLIPATGLAAWYGGVDAAGDVHELLFNVGWVLIALHVVAALYHQFVLKDRLIARMSRFG